ncbi:MAG: hypothetical protein NVV74_02580 [Magnetospirillum sp.]|nr:hypothetical protein [Magnetospirillum sp.]
MWWSAARDYHQTREEAESELAAVTRLMEQHSRAALLVGFLQISRIVDAMGRRLPRDMGGQADHDRMVRLTRDLPLSDSVWVFDADGMVRTTSYDLPPNSLNIRDRAYYTALRDGAREFISPLIWGRVRSAPFFAMSRRLDDAQGGFAGGVQVSINTGYFTEFYRTLRREPGAVFALYKDDGSLVMRSSLPAGQEEFPRIQSLVEALKRSDDGTLVLHSVLDGVERLYAYRRIPGHPLVVTAGMPLDVLFAGWRERTIRSGVIAAALLATLLIVAYRLGSTLRREGELRARAEDLLADKEVLFQEIHHRVKNNLQIIASFLTMQAVRSGDPKTAAAFEEALTRLQSMGLVHQILYEQNEATEVSMDSYLRALSASIGQTFGAGDRGISIEVQADDTRLSLDQAVPLALLANEALTNALKHAFPPGRGGQVRLALARQDSGFSFSLSDDGVGMPRTPKPGLGMTILSALARQLDGSLAWGAGPGTNMTVSFPA